MKNTTKVISGFVIAVIVIVAVISFGKADLFQGKLIGPKIAKVSLSDNCSGKWTKIFSVEGTRRDNDVTFGTINDLLERAKNGCEFKVIRSKRFDIGNENKAIECDVVDFGAYPRTPDEREPSEKTFSCTSSATTQYLGLTGGTGENIFDTTGASITIESLGYVFGYVEFANGNGEIGYNWYYTDGGRPNDQNTDSASYTVFVR